MMTVMPDSDPYGWKKLDSRRGFPRLALGLAWLIASLAVGALAWLLIAVSDRRDDAGPGWLLAGVAVLGLIAAGAVASNRRRAATLRWSLIVSGLFVTVGILVAVATALISDTTFLSDLLLLGGVPVAGGLVTGVLGLRARRMSR
jgi:hypothetical protein